MRIGIEGRGSRIEDRGARIEDRGARIKLPSPPAGEGLGERGRGGQNNSAPRAPHSCKGFTRLELVISIIVIVVLMGAFLDRVLYYQEQAEKTAMEQEAGVMQSALIMQYGELLTHGKASGVAALAQDNPMSWLEKKPRNYAGEFYDPTPLSVESGNWMFDLKSRDLIYVVRNAKYFKPGKDGKKWIRFHVAIHDDPSRISSSQTAPPDLTDVKFRPVEPYVWF